MYGWNEPNLILNRVQSAKQNERESELATNDRNIPTEFRDTHTNDTTKHWEIDAFPA